MQQSGWKLEHLHNIVVVTIKFMYKHILMRFGCPLTIVIDQGTHFINDVIIYLINHFIFRNTNFIIYYSQGNGHVKSTSKVYGTLITKLVIWTSAPSHFNHFYFHIEPTTKLEPVTPPFN